MVMKFCPKCGNLMKPKVVNGKRVMVCERCGHIVEEVASARVKLVLEHVKDRAYIAERVENLPKVKALCPRCGHNEAYFWVQQTRAADEPPTRFYRCVKCGYTWREYE